MQLSFALNRREAIETEYSNQDNEEHDTIMDYITETKNNFYVS